MLDLFNSHPGTCEKCGRRAECARVRFWDDTFAGLVCWEDLRVLVRERSQGDPQGQRNLTAAGREGEGGPRRGTGSAAETTGDSDSTSFTDGTSTQQSESHHESDQRDT